MKNFFFIIILWGSGLMTSAQKPMYLYFESQNQEPFYLKIDEKVYTSVAPGYYVLAGLEEGKYKLSVGIPSETRMESRFEIDVKGRDRGLMIKRQGQNLVLQDMHDGTTVSFIKEASQPEITYEPRNDPFTLLLSKASGDPGLLMSPVFAKAEIKSEKPEPVPAVVTESIAAVEKEVTVVKPEVQLPKTEETKGKLDSASVDRAKAEIITEKKETAAEKSEILKAETMAVSMGEKEKVAVKDSVAIETPKPATEIKEEVETPFFVKTAVKKFAESSTSEGFNLVFIDDAGGERDTIRIMIPNPRYNLVNAEIKAKEDKLFLDLKEEREKKSLDSIQGKAEASPSKGESETEAVKPKPAQMDSLTREPSVSQNPAQGDKPGTRLPKNDCKNSASENDFFKLRKNMAAQISDEEMVAEAKKSFKSRCFDTEQIKNLSSLFLTSAGKYLFFDAAFLHVSDRDQFASLENEIKDDYYKKRFKALIGE